MLKSFIWKVVSTFILTWCVINISVEACSEDDKRSFDLVMDGDQTVNVEKYGNCLWTFAGFGDCIAEVTCTGLKLPPSDDCSDGSIIIADGLGGREKLCGHESNNFNRPKKASNGGRDLFLMYSGSSKKARCSVKCGDGRAEPLKIAFKRKVDDSCVCGLKNKNDDRIVGGETATAFEFPWQAAMVNTGTRVPSCGASIINDHYILTASHCISRKVGAETKPEKIEILLHAQTLGFGLRSGWDKKAKFGESMSIKVPGWKLENTTDDDEDTIRLTVEKIIEHPLFTDEYDFDVALLKVKKKINFKKHPEVAPVCLPNVMDFNPPVGKKAIVSGWGLSYEDAGTTTRSLQKLEVPILANKFCKKVSEATYTNQMICAGYDDGKKDACNGDSGGPLSLIPRDPKNGQYTQIGIVSWGIGCARKHKPGGYTNVASVLQWIYKHAHDDASWCRTSVSMDSDEDEDNWTTRRSTRVRQ